MPDWPIKLNLNATISAETADKMAEALMDLISPATQSAGLLGDYVAYRRQVLAKILEGGLQKIQRSEGKSQAPPPKFLLEFADKASREDLESHLRELWENLLYEAAIDYDTHLVTLVDIMSRIGINEINSLKEMIPSDDIHLKNPKDSPILCENYISKISGQLLDIFSDPKDVIFKSDSDSWVTKLLEDSSFPLKVLSVRVSDHIGNASTHPVHSKWAWENSLSLELLEAHSLLRRQIREFSGVDRSVEIEFISITHLGMKLYFVCKHP